VDFFARLPRGCLSGRTTLYFTDASLPVKHASSTTAAPQTDMSKSSATATNLLRQGNGGTSARNRRKARTIVGKLPVNRLPQEYAMANSQKLPPEIVSRLRSLAHDLSNSIETIMQASYLLGQIHKESDSSKWISLIEDAAQDAAHINREIREVLRTHS